MKPIFSSIFIVAILLSFPAANADIYSWTDENGVKHFGNQPPDDAAEVKIIFKEKPFDATADQQRTETENQELNQLVRELDEQEERQRAEERSRAEKAAQNQQPSLEERAAAEKERLEAKIAELEEKPLEYFGSQKNKRVRIGYYRYRLEALQEDPDKYFNRPSQFEGNVKNTDQQ